MSDPVRMEFDGFRFRIIHADEFTWAAVAEPLPSNENRRHFYIDQSGTMRYELDRSAGPESTRIY